MQSVNETNEPLVSVVIATFNMGQYLPAAIESVLAQTWKNLEVIVVDDGSTDDTTQQMEQFEANGLVKYFRTENRGQPHAKNRGLKESGGHFIAFCDADDIWHPEKLCIQIPLFENEKTGVVYSEVSYIDQHGNEVHRSQPYKRHSGKVTQQLIMKNFVPFGTAVIRKECLTKNGYFNENLPMGIDWDLWLRFSVDWLFQYTSEKTYLYRVWPGQMSNNYRARYKNAILILESFLNKYPDEIPKNLINRAWADMYVNRGYTVACREKTLKEPLIDIMHGIYLDFNYVVAWKYLIKVLLRRI